jgi:hypothetical protein
VDQTLGSIGNKVQKPFQPVNDEHAVVECKFAIGFDKPLSGRSLHGIHTNKSNWIDLLPASGLMEMDVSDSIVQILEGPTSQAVYYATFRPDGSPVWSMRCGYNELMILCTRYTRWNPTWQLAKTLMSRALQAIVEFESVNIANIALYVEDAFLCHGDSYDVDRALNRGSWISDDVLNSGLYWHSNSGWFVKSDSGLILNHLNVGVSGGAQSFKLRLVHQQQLRLEQSLTSSQDNLPFVSDFFEKVMGRLHMANKNVLGSLLHEELAYAVKLNGSSG